ncbi:MAG: hypothetical protein AAF479_04985 [Pseudomonadota bacterium]
MFMIYDTQARFIASMQSLSHQSGQFTGRDLRKMQNPYSAENVAIRAELARSPTYKICLEYKGMRVIRLMIATTKNGPICEELKDEITRIYEPGKFARFSRGFSIRKNNLNSKRKAVFRYTEENVIEPISHIAKKSGKVAYAYTYGDEVDRQDVRADGGHWAPGAVNF